MEINWYWEKTHDVVLDMTDLPSPIEDSSCPPRSNSFLVVLEKSIMLGVSKKKLLWYMGLLRMIVLRMNFFVDFSWIRQRKKSLKNDAHESNFWGWISKKKNNKSPEFPRTDDFSSVNPIPFLLKQSLNRTRECGW